MWKTASVAGLLLALILLVAPLGVLAWRDLLSGAAMAPTPSPGASPTPPVPAGVCRAIWTENDADLGQVTDIRIFYPVLPPVGDAMTGHECAPGYVFDSN